METEPRDHHRTAVAIVSGIIDVHAGLEPQRRRCAGESGSCNGTPCGTRTRCASASRLTALLRHRRHQSRLGAVIIRAVFECGHDLRRIKAHRAKVEAVGHRAGRERN